MGTEVETRVSRAHAADPVARLKSDVETLCNDKKLVATFIVPSAAAPILLSADLQKRSVSVTMRLRAPDDRKSTKAKVSWLLRQVQKSDHKDIHVRMLWPGKTKATLHTLESLREDVGQASENRDQQTLTSFEIFLVRDMGARFSQRRNFVSDLEDVVPNFYERVGQHLKAWQAPAPRLREDKQESESVSPEAIREEAEEIALSDDA